MSSGPEAGLRIVERIVAEGRLKTYPYLHSTRADFLRRLDRRPEAAVAYREALALTANEAEQAFLRRRLAEMGSTPGS